LVPSNERKVFMWQGSPAVWLAAHRRAKCAETLANGHADSKPDAHLSGGHSPAGSEGGTDSSSDGSQKESGLFFPSFWFS
jgi:hypothetical protein